MINVLKQTLKTHAIDFSTKEYSGLGILITKIGTKENGTDGKYWQFWVNNKSPSVGVGAYPTQPGDVIEWKFLSYSEQQ